MSFSNGLGELGLGEMGLGETGGRPNYSNSQSLVKKIRCCIIIPGRTEGHSDARTHGGTTRKHNAYRWRRHKKRRRIAKELTRKGSEIRCFHSVNELLNCVA